MNRAIKLIDSISTWIGIPFSWMNIPLMLIMTYDPTMRFFFSAPFFSFVLAAASSLRCRLASGYQEVRP